MRTSRFAALFLGILAAYPAHFAGQTTASATVDIDLRVTDVAGSTEPLAGGMFWLALSQDWAIGGGAWTLPSATRDGRLSESGLELDFGYGGAAVEWTGLGEGWFGARALLGVGRGAVVDRATGSPADAEGFLVFEPSAVARAPVLSWLGVQGAVGWRSIFDFDELPRVEPDDLNGWSVSVGLRLGPF